MLGFVWDVVRISVEVDTTEIAGEIAGATVVTRGCKGMGEIVIVL